MMLRSRFQTLRPSPDLELGFTIKEYIIKNLQTTVSFIITLTSGFYKLKFLKDFYILHKLNVFSMLDFTKAFYTCNCQLKNKVGGKL